MRHQHSSPVIPVPEVTGRIVIISHSLSSPDSRDAIHRDGLFEHVPLAAHVDEHFGIEHVGVPVQHAVHLLDSLTSGLEGQHHGAVLRGLRASPPMPTDRCR